MKPNVSARALKVIMAFKVEDYKTSFSVLGEDIEVMVHDTEENFVTSFTLYASLDFDITDNAFEYLNNFISNRKKAIKQVKALNNMFNA